MNEDELESHGYETVVTRGWPNRTKYFKEKTPPGVLHRSLLFVRVWEESSISFSDRREKNESRMCPEVLRESCFWRTAVPSVNDINAKIVSWLVTVVPGAAAPFR